MNPRSTIPLNQMHRAPVGTLLLSLWGKMKRNVYISTKKTTLHLGYLGEKKKVTRDLKTRESITSYFFGL